jgi:hypothetical protein
MAGVRGIAGLNLAWLTRAEQWRKPAIVAASLLLHAGLLAWIGLRTMGLGTPLPAENPTIYLQLEPRPLLADETPRQPVAARQVEAPPLTRAMTTPNLRDEDEDAAPAPPSPRLAAPAPNAPPAPADGWTVRPRTLGDRIGQGLRTSPLGCAAGAVLSAAERAVCDDRFGQRAATARPIEGTGNPERDARFAREGARRLAEYEARRRPLAGGSGNVGPQDGPGSNFGMGVAGAHLDPSLRPDSTTNIRTNRDGRRSNDAPLTPGAGVSRDPQPPR